MTELKKDLSVELRQGRENALAHRALTSWARRHGMTEAEAIRRSVRTMEVLERYQQSGGTLVVQFRRGRPRRITFHFGPKGS